MTIEIQQHQLFAESVKSLVEEVAQTFTRPDDDFLPTLIASDDEAHGFIVGIDSQLLGSDEGKKTLIEQILPYELKRVRAAAFALILSSWIHERRTKFEAVVVHVANRFDHKIFMARIKRHRNGPPTLGGWELLGGAQGSFVSPLRNYLVGGNHE